MTREQLLLLQLGEEAAEIVKEVSKALRFGLSQNDSYPPPSCRDRLAQEINDFLGVRALLIKEKTLPALSMEMMARKIEKVEKYLKISKTLGRLTE